MNPEEMRPEEAIRDIERFMESIRGTVSEILVGEALEMAVEALRKQERMKPLSPEVDAYGGKVIPCGNCGGELMGKEYDYCPWCGQAIRWG